MPSQNRVAKWCNISKHAPAPVPAPASNSRVTVSGCAVHFQNVFSMQEDRCNSSPPIKELLEQSAGKAHKNSFTECKFYECVTFWRIMWDFFREIKKGKGHNFLPPGIIFEIPSAQCEINASGIWYTHFCVLLLVKFLKCTLIPDTLANWFCIYVRGVEGQLEVGCV